jgi:hypothetical protein
MAVRLIMDLAATPEDDPHTELATLAARARGLLVALASASPLGPAGLVDGWTRRLWATSQEDRMVIKLAGQIQDVVGEMRDACHLPELD